MAEDISTIRERKPGGVMNALSSAACEWFLMFLLFVDAAFSYLLTKFAQYCELQTPCLLCSRLDDGFGKKKPGFYWSLLCNQHRDEISTLASCSIHGKFADIHGMCEQCLTPIAMQNKYNSESYKLLVGKSWVDVDRSALQNLTLNKHVRCSPDNRICSCCGQTWRATSNGERFLDPNLIGLGASKAKLKPPLPRPPSVTHFRSRNSLKRLRNKLTRPMPHNSARRNTIGVDVGAVVGVLVGAGAGKLSNVGYTKLNISDSDSDFPFSEDDEDGNIDYSSKKSGILEHDIQCDGRSLHKSTADSDASEKEAHQGFEEKALTIDQPNVLDLSDHKNVDYSSLDTSVENSVPDIDQEESYDKPNPSSTPELSSLCEPHDVLEGSFSASANTAEPSVSLPHMPAVAVLPELLSVCNGPPSSSNVTIQKKIDVEGTSEKRDTSGANHMEAAGGTSSDADHLLEKNNMHQIDASNQGDETSELSGRTAVESTNSCDSANIEEDATQSSTSELGFLSKETFQGAHHIHNESRVVEDSSSQVLPVSASLKRNDSSYESLDGITVSDTEGEDIVDKLKRQIEHDRNCMSALYKELEEERNAAAIAANEAMAMITRLQEEKAALRMEALQYLRMVEEQAEYDMEALQRANELLAEKEKEVQDLEIELDFYRNNCDDETGILNLQENSILDNQVPAHIEKSLDASSNTKADKLLGPNGNFKLINSSVSNLEDDEIFSDNV